MPRKAGDWACVKCGIKNYASRYKCYRCDTRKPSKKLSAAEFQKSNFKHGDWECKCGVLNFSSRRACFKCNSQKPDELDADGNKIADPREAMGDWDCPSCSSINYESRVVCFRCSCPHPDGKGIVNNLKEGQDNLSNDNNGGDWNCSCGIRNFSFRTKCFICGLNR